MATCKECLHVEACEFISQIQEKHMNDFFNEQGKEISVKFRLPDAEKCLYFKDRSRFVELPCKDGEYVYVIEPLCDSMAFHTIKHRKIKHIEPQARIQFAGGGWILNFLSAFNQYVFRTYEEAEQALKEREENA